MANHLRSVFAQNLRSTVERKGMRLNRVADQAGVSRAQMYNVLAGRSSPSLDWISKVSLVLEVSPAELLIERSSGSVVDRDSCGAPDVVGGGMGTPPARYQAHGHTGSLQPVLGMRSRPAPVMASPSMAATELDPYAPAPMRREYW